MFAQTATSVQPLEKATLQCLQHPVQPVDGVVPVYLPTQLLLFVTQVTSVQQVQLCKFHVSQANTTQVLEQHNSLALIVKQETIANFGILFQPVKLHRNLLVPSDSIVQTQELTQVCLPLLETIKI